MDAMSNAVSCTFGQVESLEDSVTFGVGEAAKREVGGALLFEGGGGGGGFWMGVVEVGGVSGSVGVFDGAVEWTIGKEIYIKWYKPVIYATQKFVRFGQKANFKCIVRLK